MAFLKSMGRRAVTEAPSLVRRAGIRRGARADGWLDSWGSLPAAPGGRYVWSAVGAGGRACGRGVFDSSFAARWSDARGRRRVRVALYRRGASGSDAGGGMGRWPVG